MEAVLQPTEDRVLIKAERQGEQTIGGVIVPEVGDKRPHRGRVVAVGPGRRYDNGVRIPVAVDDGDLVYFAKFGGSEVTLEGDDILILRESDLHAVVAE